MRKKEKEEKGRESLEKNTTQDNPVDHLASSNDTIIGGHIPLFELGLVPLTPSEHHTVACLDIIFFDKSRKTIVRRLEKRLKIGTQLDVITVTEKIVVEHTNQDPKFLHL